MSRYATKSLEMEAGPVVGALMFPCVARGPGLFGVEVKALLVSCSRSISLYLNLDLTVCINLCPSVSIYVHLYLTRVYTCNGGIEP